MPTTIPLHVFVRCLKSAKEFDRDHSAFSQVRWMLEHWSFDDNQARYPQLCANVMEEQEEARLK
jgi:hypothetical protein